MLNINDSKVLKSYVKNSKLFIEFDNGTIFSTFDGNYVLTSNFNFDLFKNLSGKKLNSNVLNCSFLDSLLDIPSINSDLFINLELNDLIGMVIEFDVTDDYILINLIVPADYLITNSTKFCDCKNEYEVTEYNENVVCICEIDLTKKDFNEIYGIYNKFKFVLI